MRLISCFSPCGRTCVKDFADDGPEGAQATTPSPIMESCTSEALTNTGPVKILSVDTQPWRVASPKDQPLLSQLSPGCLTPLTWLGEGAYGCVELCRVSIPVLTQSNNVTDDVSLQETQDSIPAAERAEPPPAAPLCTTQGAAAGDGGGSTAPDEHLSPRETVIVRPGRFTVSRLRLSPREPLFPSPSPTTTPPAAGTRPCSSTLGRLLHPHRKSLTAASDGVSPVGTTAPDTRGSVPSPASAACTGTTPCDVRQLGPSGTFGRMRSTCSSPSAPASARSAPTDSPHGSTVSNELVVAVKRIDYREKRGGGCGGGARGADGCTGAAGGGGGGSRPRGGNGPSRTRLNRMQAIELLQLARCRDCPFIVRVFGCVPDEPPPRHAAGPPATSPRGVSSSSVTNSPSSACRIVMEWAEGGDLGSLLKALAARRSPCSDVARERLLMSEASARYYLACLLEALAFLHSKSLLHRDVKPANLLLTSDGRAKLGDLGMVCHLDKEGCAVGRAGTPNYMAPEVWAYGTSSKYQSYGANADLWSAGIVLYELITGRLPASHPDEYLRPSWRFIPRHAAFSLELRDLLSRLLCAKPRRRLQSCAEVAAHPWFADFDWKALRDGTLPAPYVPSAHRPIGVVGGGVGPAASATEVMPPVLEERATSGEGGNGQGDGVGDGDGAGVGCGANDGGVAAASGGSLLHTALQLQSPSLWRSTSAALRFPSFRYGRSTGKGQSCPASPAAAPGATAGAGAGAAFGAAAAPAAAGISGVQPHLQPDVPSPGRQMARAISMPAQRQWSQGSLPESSQPRATPLSSVTSLDVAVPVGGGAGHGGGGGGGRLLLLGSVLASALGGGSSRLGGGGGALRTTSARYASGGSAVQLYGGARGDSPAGSRTSAPSMGPNPAAPRAALRGTGARASAPTNTDHSHASGPDCTASGAGSTNPSVCVYGVYGTERGLSRTQVPRSPPGSPPAAAAFTKAAGDRDPSSSTSSRYLPPRVRVQLYPEAPPRSPSRTAQSYLAAASCLIGCLAPAMAPTRVDPDSASSSSLYTPANPSQAACTVRSQHPPVGAAEAVGPGGAAPGVGDARPGAVVPSSVQLSSVLAAMASLQQHMQGLGPASRRAGDWLQQRLSEAAAATVAVPEGILTAAAAAVAAATAALATSTRRQGSATGMPLAAVAGPRVLPLPAADVESAPVQEPPNPDPSAALGAAGEGPDGGQLPHDGGQLPHDGGQLPHGGGGVDLGAFASSLSREADAATAATADGSEAVSTTQAPPSGPALALMTAISLADMMGPPQPQQTHPEAESAEVVVFVRRTCAGAAGGGGAAALAAIESSFGGGIADGATYDTPVLGPDRSDLSPDKVYEGEVRSPSLGHAPSLLATPLSHARPIFDTMSGQVESTGRAASSRDQAASSPPHSASSLSPRLDLSAARAPSFSFDVGGIPLPAGLYASGTPVLLLPGGAVRARSVTTCAPAAAQGEPPGPVAPGMLGLTPRTASPRAPAQRPAPQRPQELASDDAGVTVSPRGDLVVSPQRKPLPEGDALAGAGETLGAVVAYYGGHAHGHGDSSSRVVLYSACSVSAALVVLVCAWAWTRVLMDVAYRSQTW